MLGKIFKKKPLALRIGDTAPDFKAETTTGDISFHEWIGSSYVMIFSHPKDFTPVCSTELSRTAALKPCLLYTSPSPRDDISSRMPSSA